jgi:pilus assembly protein CpaB
MMRRFIYFCLAIAISGGTVLLTQQWLHSQLAGREAGQSASPVAAVVPRIQVLVAKADIPGGAFLSADSLRWQELPQDTLGEGYVQPGKVKPEDFAGTVLKSALNAGQPITLERIVRPGDRGFMAAILTPGTRAVTVNVTPSTGMAGFVSTGDRVDLILSMVVQPTQKDAPPRHMSETVITDLRVLAMDQHISEDRKDTTTAPKTATLEVTPKQAELVAVASELGLLSLSLRSLGAGTDEASPTASTPTWDTDATRLLAVAGGARTVEVIRGSEATAVSIPAMAAGGPAKP